MIPTLNSFRRFRHPVSTCSGRRHACDIFSVVSWSSCSPRRITSDISLSVANFAIWSFDRQWLTWTINCSSSSCVSLILQIRRSFQLQEIPPAGGDRLSPCWLATMRTGDSIERQACFLSRLVCGRCRNCSTGLSNNIAATLIVAKIVLPNLGAISSNSTTESAITTVSAPAERSIWISFVGAFRQFFKCRKTSSGSAA